MQRHHPLEIVGEFGAMLRLILREGVAGEIMGVTDVVDARQMGREGAAVRHHAADRHAAEADAVIAALAADQARPRSLSDGALIGQRDLQRGVDRLGAGIGEEDAVEPLRRDLGEPLGEIERQRMAHVERGREVEVRQLPLDGGGDLAAAMAGIDAPEAGRAVDHLAAVDGGVVHALGGSEQPRRFLELPVGRERHPERIGLQGVRLLMKGHGVAPVLAAQGTTGPRSGSHNKSFSSLLQPIDFAGPAGAYLFDPKHLQQGFPMSVDIGGRLRFVRARHKLSQRELAKRSGVTNSTISLIESNQMNPSVGALKRILDGLPMGLAEFFAIEPERPRKAFYRADELTEIGKKPISFRQVGDNLFGRSLQILKERYEPGSDTGRVPLTHDGEEGGIVVSGRLEVTVDDERRILDPGDAYYFESRRPHRFRCVGGKAVRSDLGLHAADVLKQASPTGDVSHAQGLDRGGVERLVGPRAPTRHSRYR